MDMTPNDLVYREALVTDRDAILNITKDENLYDGKDYLPHYLREWLEEGIDKMSNRRNLVFLLHNNQIVGYESLYFQNGGTVVAFFAKRIIKDIRGMGFGRKLSELTIEYLNFNFPLVTQTIVSIANRDLQDSEFFNSKHGELLMNKAIIFYQVTMEKMTNHLVKYTTSLPEPHLYGFLTKDEFKQILRNKSFVSAALENDTIVINWIPILVKTEEDIKFAVTNNQNVLLEGSIENPIALSIFTCPFPIAGGKTRSALDFYTCKPNSKRITIVEHLAQHLDHFNKCNEHNNTTSTEKNKETFFEIFSYHEDTKEVKHGMQVAGVGDKQKIGLGTQHREILSMNVYLNKL